MFPLAGYLLLGQNATSLFCFWLLGCWGGGGGGGCSPNVSEGGRTQQFGGVFILICDFQPLLDIGNPLQLPSALNVKLLSITIFFSCLLPLPPSLYLPPPRGHGSGGGADDLLVCHGGPASSRDRTQDDLTMWRTVVALLLDSCAKHSGLFPFNHFHVGLLPRFYDELRWRRQ